MSESLVQSYPNIPTPLIGRRHKTAPRSRIEEMESRRLRIRGNYKTPLETIDVVWHFTEDEFDTFRSWFITDLCHGANSFEMVTYEPSDGDGLVRETTRTLAFLNAQYNWDHSDNLFAVSSVLEVIDESYKEIANPTDLKTLTVEYDDEVCKDTFTLKWELLLGEQNILETSDSPNGPWSEYIYAAPEPEHLLSGIMDMKINNSYDGKRYFRVAVNGAAYTGFAKPEKSTIPAPTISITHVVASSRAMQQLGGDFTRPYSWKENDKIQDLDVYVEPAERFEDEDDAAQGWDGNGRIVTVTNPDVTVLEHSWTQDGTDPEQGDPVPIVDGIEGNAGCYRFDFKGVIKARSYKDGCRSPVTFVLVDRVYGMLPFKQISGTFQAASAYCDQVRTAVIGGVVVVYESGFSCGDIDNPECTAFAKADSAVSSGMEPSSWLDDSISSRSVSFTGKKTWMGWDGIFCGISHKIGSSCQLLPGPPWNSMPNLFDNLDWRIEWTPSSIGDPGFSEDYYEGGFLLGSSGDPSQMNSLLTGVTGLGAGNGITNGTCGQLTNDSWWSRMDVVVTAHHDFPKPVTTISYPDPFTPPDEEPPLPADINGDDFETYAETNDASLATLDDGENWSAAWVLEDLPGNGKEGDSFEDYSSVSDLSTINGGLNMQGFWIVDEPIHEEGGDDFESYDEATISIADVLPSYDGGENWDDEWDFGQTFVGVEDFEEYDTGTLLTGTLTAANPWVNGWVSSFELEDN